MKKYIPFRPRLEIALYWLFYKGNTKGFLFESCPICEGLHFTLNEIISDDKNVYRAQYICKRCGAIGKVEEKWEEVTEP